MTKRNLEDMVIELAPITIAAFKTQTSYWADYEAIARDDITSLRVIPRILGFRYGNDFSISIDCYFEDERYTVLKYNLPYGDDTFENAVSNHIKEVLGCTKLSDIGYTEAGMQTEEYISMEVGSQWSDYFTTISSHALLALTEKPQIRSISLDGFVWNNNDPVDCKAHAQT